MLILERGEGRKGKEEGKRGRDVECESRRGEEGEDQFVVPLISVFIRWLVLVCVLTRNQASILGIAGQCLNQMTTWPGLLYYFPLSWGV